MSFYSRHTHSDTQCGLYKKAAVYKLTSLNFVLDTVLSAIYSVGETARELKTSSNNLRVSVSFF